MVIGFVKVNGPALSGSAFCGSSSFRSSRRSHGRQPSSVHCIVVPPNSVIRMRCTRAGYRLEVAQPRERTPVVCVLLDGALTRI
eukprot:5394616-Pyramimonas_sp.AAC.1